MSCCLRSSGSWGNINFYGKVGFIACRCQLVTLNSFLSTNSYISCCFLHSLFLPFLPFPPPNDR